MKKIILLLPLFVVFQLHAQHKDITGDYLKKYPSDNAVYLKRHETSTIKIVKGQLKIFTKTEEDLLLLNDKVNSYTDRPIYYSSFSQISGITAKTLVPDGKGSYSAIPVKDKYTTNEFSDGSFFDDSKALHLVYTGLKQGGRIQLNYTEELDEPRFFGRFFFSAGIPMEDAVFTVQVPEGVKIEWKLYNISESELEMTQVTKGKTTTYTWKRKFCPKYKSDDDAPAATYFAPHIVVFIKEYTVKKKTTQMLDGPEGLYDWYYSMVKDVNTTEDPVLRHVVDSLVTDAPDQQTKVKRIFYWVQDNIRYVAFEDGLGGFVPREAKTICSRRYGDCKDMASLTTTMLRMAGIPAYMTWIGTRDIPYTYTDVPSPMVDNHMICTYIDDGKYYFLDATGKDTPFGMPTSMIQGKQALIGKGDGKFELATVPVLDPSKNIRTDTVFMYFGDDNSVKGNGVMHAYGYEKVALYYAMDGMTDKERRDFFKKFLHKGNNRFVVDSLDYDNLNDRDKNLDVTYKYTIGGYQRVDDDQVYINMQLDKAYMNQLLDSADRTAPMEIDHETDNVQVSVLQVPDGYTVSCMPQDQSYDGTDFGFKITYRQDGNKIICRKETWIKTLMVNAPQFGKWNEFVRALTKAYNENITLQKVKTPVKPIKAKKK